MLAELSSARGLARVGALACAALTLIVGIFRLFDDALPGQNHWATLNSEETSFQRTFPSDEFIGSGKVAAAARQMIPPDASYAIAVGSKYTNTPWGFAAPNFFTGFLFPRHRDDSGSSPWLICLGCDAGQVGSRTAVAADGGNGVKLVRAGQ